MIDSDALDLQEGFNSEQESSQASSSVMKQKKANCVKINWSERIED